MTQKLRLSTSPHIYTSRTTSKVMLDVIIALLPATIAGTLLFGFRALAIIAACVITSVLAEALFALITKKEQTVSDLSAVVTGLLIGLNLSINCHLWQAAVGSAFAIIVVKCLFGGIGCNLVNPAITARVFMLISFGAMTKGAYPVNVDTFSGATPLAELTEVGSVTPSVLDLFLGKHGGAIGETCILALVIGLVYLLVRKVISWHIPISFIATVYLFSLIYEGFDFMAALVWILSGGLFIGAIFMATDYVTSPSTPLGKLIFGIGCGAFTVLIRFFGTYPEGVSFAILFMNILTPYIDSLTPRKLFGGKAK